MVKLLFRFPTSVVSYLFDPRICDCETLINAAPAALRVGPHLNLFKLGENLEG
jgi:hypothetical protein